MLQWKQRLYAFLLRRALGPALDAESANQLHRCIDVSLHEGKFVLFNVGLDVEYLTSRLKPSESGSSSVPAALRVRKAAVRRLEICLSLVERSDDDEDAPAGGSSFAWRAMQLGSAATSTSASASAVSLVAKVEVEGVVLEVEPFSASVPENIGDDGAVPEPSENNAESLATETYSAAAKSMLTSYIDAALASLRLSVQILDLTVRLYNGGGDEDSPPDDSSSRNEWIELGVEAASYRDNPNDTRSDTAAADRGQTILNKTIDLRRIALRTGEGPGRDEINNQSTSSTTALLDGYSQLALRAVEYSVNSDRGNVRSTSSASPPRRKQMPPHVQHDVQLNLGRLNVSADSRTLERIQAVLRSLHLHSKAAAAAASASTKAAQGCSDELESLPHHSVEAPVSMLSHKYDDESDLKTIDGIMKEYYEARVLAQQNHFRNGILLPSDDVEDALEPTFDAFFDANDQSFARYSTVLHESMILGGGVAAASLSSTSETMVHTKLRIQLSEGSFKIAFAPPPSPSGTTSRPSGADEYLLLTLVDIQTNSSLSRRHSEHSLTIAQLDVEDSQVEEGRMSSAQEGGCLPAPVGRRVEISSVLRFDSVPSIHCGDTMGELLVQPQCLSLSVRTESEVTGHEGKDPSFSVEVELQVEPMELTYRHGTMANLQKFIHAATEDKHDKNCNDSIHTTPSQDCTIGTTASLKKPNLSLNASCSSLTITVPVLVEKDWGPLFYRCGYSCDTSWARKSSIGLLFDELVFESNSNADEPEVSLACNQLVAFAKSTSGNHVMDRKSRRFDIFCLSGHHLAHTSEPMSIRFWRSSSVEECENHGARTFPKVPTISSFKARQEDEDDDILLDQVLSSSSKKFEGLHHVSTARKNLRGNDPQADMLLEASKSKTIIEVRVPEIMADFSIEELSIISNMLQLAFPVASAVEERREDDEALSTVLTDASRACIALECDFVSLGVHDENPGLSCEDHQDSDPGLVSFVLHLDTPKVHILRDGSSLRQARILAREVDLYELSCPAKLAARVKVPTKSCIEMFRHRVVPNANFPATPLLHRSHLFSPISPQSPMLLVDILDQSAAGGTDQREPILRSVHFTLYDMTHRYDRDSRWIERLMSILRKPGSSSECSQEQSSPCQSQVTRTFLTLADCNIDYASPLRFKTPSRMIVRVGDLRLSSNIVWPKPAVQAFSVALGDAAAYLCKSRYPYNFENSQLPRSKFLMCASALDLSSLRLPSRATAENVQKAMNYLTMATLESFDAVVTLTNRELGLVSEPEIVANLTIGDLCMFACKDSFKLFVSTISELTTELTALGECELEALKAKSYMENVEETSTDDEGDDSSEEKTDNKFHSLEELKNLGVLGSAAGTSRVNHAHDFLLDGYDWTTIDQDETSTSGIPPGEEQAARWYGSKGDMSSDTNMEIAFLPTFSPPETAFSAKPLGSTKGPNIITHHFPIVPVADPLGDEDMGLSKYAGTKSIPRVKSRVLVHDLNLKIRFFDGYDWPELLDDRHKRATLKGAFVIDGEITCEAEEKGLTKEVAEKMDDRETEALERKARLMGDLLAGNDNNISSTPGSIFQDIPLPEEKGASLIKQADLQRFSRRAGKYFQLAASGISVRVDSLEECSEHRLASCMNIKAQDFFIAETISSDRPVKLTGEWVNEKDHPRDTKDGLFMMKMVTWHPSTRVTPDKDIANDESEAVVKLLPLRCIIDQKAVRFIRAFFRSKDEGGDDHDGGGDESSISALSPNLYAIPPPLFRSFRFKPCKIKVDYRPEKIDTRALRDGAFIELINLSPLDGMILTLDGVGEENVVGFGDVLSLAVRQWIADVASTQMYKFLTSTRYLEPFANVGGASADLIVLPWEAVRNGESLSRALRAAVDSFSGAVAYEACTTASRAAQFVANKASKLSSFVGSRDPFSGGGAMPLPPRPLATPRGLMDTGPHALESLSRGFQTASYKVIVVPYREYRRRGPRSAVTSVLRGIPVAIAAPTSGTAEAVSFALLGARNALLPDIRKEEESLERGLHFGS